MQTEPGSIYHSGKWTWESIFNRGKWSPGVENIPTSIQFYYRYILQAMILRALFYLNFYFSTAWLRGGGLFSLTMENVPPTTYLQSSAFEINEYYLINIITSISMNRGTESRAWKWKYNCEKNMWDRSQ